MAEHVFGVGHRRVRIWTGELPEAAILMDETTYQTRTLEHATGLAHHSAVAVEVFRPLGPMAEYGLLGGQFERTSDYKLTVHVPIETPLPEKRYEGSLARRVDIVTVGGTSEFVTAILDAIDQLDSAQRPSGILTLNCMAHGAVGSSRNVFRHVSSCLIRVFTQAAVGPVFDGLPVLPQI